MDFFQKNNIKVEPMTMNDVDAVTELFTLAYKDFNPLVKMGFRKQNQIRARLKIFIPTLLNYEKELNQILNKDISLCTKYTHEGRLVSAIILIDMVHFKKYANSIDENKLDVYYRVLKNNYHKTDLGRDAYFGQNCVSSEYMKIGISRHMLIQRMEYLLGKGYQFGYAFSSHQSMKKFGSFLDAIAVDYAYAKNSIDGKPYPIQFWGLNLQGGVQKFKTVSSVRKPKEVAKL